MKVKIQIDTQTFVRFWLVVIGFALAGYALYSARTGIIILGSALFLALALNGSVSRLAHYLPGNSRIFSTAISYVVVVAVLGSFIFLATPPIVEQTAKFAQTVPSLVDTARKQSAGLNEFITTYNLQSQVDNVVRSVEDSASSWATSVGSSLVSGIGSFFAFLAALFLTLVLSFLMLIEGPQWMQRIWGLYRDKEQMEYHRRITDRAVKVVSSYINGQLTVSGLGAVFAGLTVFILSLFAPVPANLAIPTAAVTFILSLIPMFGSTIAGALITVVLLLNSPGAAIIYVVFFIVYQQIENNFISPSIQSRQIDLSPLAVLASVTVGLYLFGLAGGIISIPIAGIIKVLIEENLARSKAKREKSKKPLGKLAKAVKREA